MRQRRETVGDDIDLTDTKTWPEPPLEGNWKEVDPPSNSKSGKKSQELGQKRLQNEKGDILRPHKPDKYHPKWHWDFKPGKSPKSEWENYTPEGLQIPKGKIYGKDFNPFMIIPSLTPKIQQLYKEQLKEYNKKMDKYKQDLREYKQKMNEYYKKSGQMV